MPVRPEIPHTHVLLLCTALGGCSPGGSGAEGSFATATQTDGMETTTEGATSGSPTSGLPPGTTSGQTTDADDGMIFDVGSMLDLPPSPPMIPTTCEQAAEGETSVGCLFYPVDLDQHQDYDHFQYAVLVSNVQEEKGANVTIEQKIDGAWTTVGGPLNIPPLDLFTFELPNNHQVGSGIKEGGAFRLSSDVPVIAYQVNPLPIFPGSYSSDASMLYPVPTWDTVNHVVGWVATIEYEVELGAYVTVVAAKDGTEVEITPSVATLPGPGVPEGVPGVPFTLVLDEGDIAEIMTKTFGQGLTGTRITSQEDHPIGVYSAHQCAFVPKDAPACDHLEAQLSGVRMWGKRFIASRMPVRDDPATPEDVLWQVYASEDATTVLFNADGDIMGVPNEPLLLDQGEAVELMVTGTAPSVGDFEIEADKPIAVVQYMTGSSLIGAGQWLGDPSMVQLSPVEQFLPRYVVLVPTGFAHDYAVITRPAGAEILLDGEPIADELFVATASSGYEVARIPLASDGGFVGSVHKFDGGTVPFGIMIVGYDQNDSYAYLGGAGTVVLNPDPAG